MTFHNIVSRATILGSFMNGVEGSYDGRLHVVNLLLLCYFLASNSFVEEIEDLFVVVHIGN